MFEHPSGFGDKCQINHALMARDRPQYNCDRWHRDESLFRLISLTKYYGNACLHSWNSNYQHQYQFLCAVWCVNLRSLLLLSNCGNHLMSLLTWYCDRMDGNQKHCSLQTLLLFNNILSKAYKMYTGCRIELDSYDFMLLF